MKTFHFILSHFGWLVVGLVPVYLLFHSAFFLIGLPLRRQERARVLLDLLEIGLRQGESAERTIISASDSQDRSVGVKFHLLAAHLRAGWGLIPSLHRVSGLLPPPVVAMLKAGGEIGDLRRVLPACRALLRDGANRVELSYNYFVVMLFVLIPVTPALFWAMTIFVFPKLKQLFESMMEDEMATSSPWMMVPDSFTIYYAKAQLVLALVVYVGAVFYVGGPRLIAWLQAGFPSLQLDWLLHLVPWRARRMHRDFTAMLAILLDAGLPEQRAVELAAESTANQYFQRRVGRVVVAMRNGVPLPQALKFLDRTGELQWRLANALRSGKNFLTALNGWLESLDARAFQQEHVAAQLLTTGLVLANGAMVGIFSYYVFSGINQILQQAVLW